MHVLLIFIFYSLTLPSDLHGNILIDFSKQMRLSSPASPSACVSSSASQTIIAGLSPYSSLCMNNQVVVVASNVKNTQTDLTGDNFHFLGIQFEITNQRHRYLKHFNNFIKNNFFGKYIHLVLNSTIEPREIITTE